MSNQPRARGPSENPPERKTQPVCIKLQKDQLMNRLYEQGFSHYTMPSVERPITDNSHKKPVQCKLYSLSSNLTKQGKQKQNSILFNVPDQSYLSPENEEMMKSQHSAFMYTNDNFYKKAQLGQTMSTLKYGNPSYANNQDKFQKHIFVEGEIQEENYDGKNENPEVDITSGYRKATKFNAAQTMTAGFNRTQGFNGNKKQRLLTPMTALEPMNFSKGFTVGNTTGQSFYQKPDFPDFVKKSVMTAGNFYNPNQIESSTQKSQLKHSKLIIDKLRGQFDEREYMEQKDSILKADRNVEQKNQTGSLETQAGGQAHDSKLDQGSGLELEGAKRHNIDQKEKDEIEAAADLDSYIDLILKNNSNVDEFIYLTPMKEGSDPYKLKLAKFSQVNKKDSGATGKKEPQVNEYYTISGKGLCHYKNGKPVEFIELTNWLKERETFKQIQNLQFFQKFRRWKTLKMWKQSCQTYKRNHYAKQLSQKLFISDKFLKNALFEHRKLCFHMSSEKFIDLSSKGEGNEVIGLNSFGDNQQNKRDMVKRQIQSYSHRCRKIISQSFNECLEHLRNHEFKKEKDTANRPENQNFFRIKETAYERLGFQTNMNYDQRSQIRQLCIKFLRFSFLIDFIALDSLCTIYMNSIVDLKDQLESLSIDAKPTIYRDFEKGKGMFGGILPMFRIEVDFDEERPNKAPEVLMEQISYFQMPENQEAAPEEYSKFNILGHPFLIDFKDLTSMEKIERRQVEEFNDKKEFFQKRVTNIHQMWLSLNPNMNRFFSEIQKIFTDGMNCLLCFERWSRHPEMEPYSSILEDWDEQVGESGESEGNTFLNPDLWVDQQFKSENVKDIQNLLRRAFNKAEDYLSKFMEFLQIYWEYKNLDFDLLMDESLAKPRVIIRSLMLVNQYHKTYFESHIPYQADIGLLRIGSFDLKEKLKPYPEEVIEILKERLPEELRRRLGILTEWIIQASANLNKQEDDEIKAFVTQKHSLDETEREFPFIRERIKIVNELYKVIKEFQIDCSKDDYIKLQDLKSTEANLSNEIMTKNNEMNKNQQVVAKIIKEEKVPELKAKINRLNDICEDTKYLDELSETDNMIEELQAYWDQLQEYKNNAKELNYFEEEVNLEDDGNFEKTDFDNLKSLEISLNSKLTLWKSLKFWNDKKEQISQQKLSEIDLKACLKETESANTALKVCRRSIPPDNAKLRELIKAIKRFERTIKVVDAMLNEDLKVEENMVDKIFDILKTEKVPFENMVLQELVDLKVFKYQAEIVKISKQVTQENLLDQEFEKNVMGPWKEFKILLKPHDAKDHKDPVYILDRQGQMVDDVDKLLTDVNNIYANKYLSKHKPKVIKLREQISFLSVCIDEWIQFQAQWVYLEKIFNSQEFKRELKETSRFEKINAKYKKMAKDVNNDPQADKLSKSKQINFKKHLIPNLKDFNKQLNQINKSINDFLDKKREVLYRLHFVSNEEMIIILAKSDQPSEVQGFIGKLFENIKCLDFGEAEGESLGQEFKGIISRELEVLPFKAGTVPSIKENIESWMPALEAGMKAALSQRIQEGFERIIEPDLKVDFYLDGISQVVSVVHQVFWTVNTQDAINEDDKDALWEWYKEIYKNLKLLTELVRAGQKGYRHDILVAIVTQEVHNKDIVEALSHTQIESSDEFGWQQQLRYEYNRDEGKLLIRQINASFNYGYEYLGPTSRIVITPLTDRCWITITSALHLGLGAAPAGPAGTGKTESTKDLAKSLGRLCIVFNCSDQVTYNIMERLFRGVIFQGAWTCLDEFNRIDIEVLSVIAQQLLDLHIGKIEKDGTKEFLFVGKPTKLNKDCGVFITMNPGYAGRTELPDNLKVLFRPVSMMIPNYEMIAQILLYSEGFDDSDVLAGKMKNLYKLASEQLSQQKHYDFGMRAVKSVLVMAGVLRRQNPEENEDIILIRAMRDANLPKFLEDDLILFNALVKDLFPTIIVEDQKYEDLGKAVSLTLESKSLEHQNVDGLKQKVKELFQTLNVRFGVMVVGDAMVGKSTCIHSLKDAMTYLRLNKNKDERFCKIHATFMNPKSITMGELYGEENELTKDWSDGLASHYIRLATQQQVDGEKIWIIFDGPVDAIWIENMNSVLDDSKLLCLANGQRIRLGEHMKILFEVRDLDQASPATVSRCGMVYMSPKDLGFKVIIKRWFREKILNWRIIPGDDQSDKVLDEELQDLFWEKIEDALDEIINRTSKYKNHPIPTKLIQKVQSFCNYMDIYLSPDNGFRLTDNAEKKEAVLMAALSLSFCWAFGGPLYEQEQDYVSTIVRDKFMMHSEEPLYNMYLDYETQSLFSWSDKLDKLEFEDSIKYYDLIVPTADTVKISYIMKALFRHQKHVFLTGRSGVGKSVLSHAVFKDHDSTMFKTLQFIFSAKTDANQTQETILAQGNLEEKNKYTKTAKPGCKNVIVIDDINMPAVEDYGAQPPIELLRQLIDFGYLYDKRDKFAIHIEETCMLAVAAPAGGGRAQLTERFTRHFNVISQIEPTNNTLKIIFGTIMGHFLRKYTKKVVETIPNVVSATIQIFQDIKEAKLPIPSKFHYCFNLRDVSKVFMGMTQSSEDRIKSEHTLIRMWVHETSRVFHDRLINQEDKDWFYDTVSEVIKNGFTNINRDLFEKKLIFETNKIRFSAIMAPGAEDLYDDLEKKEQIVSALMSYQADFNDSRGGSTKLNLVFFEEAMDHLLRIYRILNMPRGNAMLIGIGGLGKQSMTRLSSHILNYKVQDLDTGSGFRQDLFATWLRTAVLKECAGVDADKDGKPMTFLVLDSQIVDESILEMINNLLNSGEVPNIFPPEEKDQLIQGLKEIIAVNGESPDNSTTFKAFIERVRSNLHIVMCMSPIGDRLRVWCRKFPAMVDCCSIDWYNNWPREALFSVSKKLLEGGESSIDLEEAEIVKICKIFECFHDSASKTAERFQLITKRRMYITPKSLLDLVNLFKELYSKKKSNFDDNVNTLKKGTVKLVETNAIVAKLEVDLEEMRPILKEKKEIAALKSIEMEKSTQIVMVKKENAEREAEYIAEEKALREEEMNRINSILEEYEPQIRDTKERINSLEKGKITTFKASLNNPAASIKQVVKTLCLILNEKWDEKQLKQLVPRLIPDANVFKANLIGKMNEIGQDPSVLKPNTVKLLKEYVEDPIMVAEYDDKADKQKINYPLAKYCRSIYDYHDLIFRIDPQRKQAEIAGRNLRAAEENLAKIQAELAEVEKEADLLKEEFDELKAEEARLEFKINDDNIKLDRAKILNVLLKDEGVSWEIALRQYEIDVKTILGNIVLSAGAISYFGPLSGIFRQELYEEWHKFVIDNKILINPFNEYNITEVLGDRLEIRDWQNCGLPTDQVSTENAIFALNGFKWPLMIDPQLQAKNWLKSYFAVQEEQTDQKAPQVNQRNQDYSDEEESEENHYGGYEPETAKIDVELCNPGLKILREDMDQTRFIQILKNAITKGFPVLIEDIEDSLMPVLDPLIAKQIQETHDGTLKIKFDEELEYDPNFKLFMTCKISNPQFLPDVFIKSNVINFTVTVKGLEDQLLGDVVRIEDPNLEKTKSENIEKLTLFRKTLVKQQKDILRLLGNTETSPVDDPKLVETLQESNKISKEINIKLEESRISNEAINTRREEYRPVATRGSLIYFVIDDISKIDPMYQYSLQYIKKLFSLAIESAQKSDGMTMEEIISVLKQNITKIIYTNVSRGLFEEHKFIFSLMICTQVNIQAGLLSNDLWNIFLQGPPVVNREIQDVNPDKDKISVSAWDLAYYLDKNVEKFSGLCSDITTNLPLYVTYSESQEPYDTQIPKRTRMSTVELQPFDKLFLIKILKPDKLLFSLARYVEEYMGNYYVGSLEVKMIDVYKDSDSQTPIVFVLSQGADPKSLITGLVKKLEKREKRKIEMRSISLGQGQGSKAAKCIEKGCEEGFWVLLENCHLSKSWMPELEKIIQKIQTSTGDDKPHEDFRLFLTSMPALYFPVTILENGIKLTTEPPRGIKANMIRSLNDVEDKAYLDAVNEELRPAMHKLTIGLCFFHAIIQERRKFGPLGWNKRYEFNDSDLETSKKVLFNFIKEIETIDEIPWESLVYLTGTINYGGRVTDDFDNRCLLTIMKLFYTKEILDPKYAFCESSIYYIPQMEDLAAYKAYASKLPLSDDPKVFGMMGNANITYQSQETEKILTTVQDIKTSVVNVDEFSKTPDQIVMELVDQFLDQELGVPELIGLIDIYQPLMLEDSNGLKPSLTTVLLQEVDRFNILLKVVRDSLDDLKKAILGTIVMSQDLDEVYQSFLKLKVPELWANYAYPSLKGLISWIADLRVRVDFMKNWVAKGNPLHYWMPGLFFPQGFLTGVLQTYARENQIPIDKLKFEFQVSELFANQIEELPELGGVYISGLYLDGAKWSKKSLVDQDPGILYPSMPAIIFRPIIDPAKMDEEEKREYEKKRTRREIPFYQCPLYKTTVRAGTLSTTGQSTNFILSVDLPAIEKSPDTWVLRGAALICQMKDQNSDMMGF